MLIQILMQQPRMLGSIVQNTPGWVWGLLAALLALGASQWAPRRASQWRIAILPAAMTVFAVVGLITAFAGAAHRLSATALWLTSAAGCTLLALWLRPQLPTGTRFDPHTRHFELPGSALPLLTILGIFLTKYVVAIELALQPALTNDLVFTLGVATLYGLFNGIFTARFIRLWRLTGPSARRRSCARPIHSERQSHAHESRPDRPQTLDAAATATIVDATRH